MKNSMTHVFCYLIIIIIIFLAKLSYLLLKDDDIRYHS